MADFFAFDSLEGTMALGDRGILAPRDLAERNRWTIGTSVELEFEQTGDKRFVVEGIVDGVVYEGMTITRDAFAANFAVSTDSRVYVQLAEGVSAADGLAAVGALAADLPTVDVQTLEQQGQEIADQIDQLLQLITALLAMTVLISLFGVMNTMLLAVFERTREIGLLRAVGLDRPQTRRMIRTEAAIISVFGALLGVGLGVFFAWAVSRALAAEGFTVFIVPVPILIAWIAVIGVLGLLFAVWPAWRASRLNVLEAIAYE
jgi:putative ABC transport system permease protein